MGDNSITPNVFLYKLKQLGTEFKDSKACCLILGMLMTIRWTWGRWRQRRNSAERTAVCTF